MGAKHTATSGMWAAGLRKAGRKADRVVAPTMPVDRDPCPRCGVRGDIPCGHSKTRLGTVL